MTFWFGKIDVRKSFKSINLSITQGWRFKIFIHILLLQEALTMCSNAFSMYAMIWYCRTLWVHWKYVCLLFCLRRLPICKKKVEIMEIVIFGNCFTDSFSVIYPISSIHLNNIGIFNFLLVNWFTSHTLCSRLSWTKERYNNENIRNLSFFSVVPKLLGKWYSSWFIKNTICNGFYASTKPSSSVSYSFGYFH